MVADRARGIKEEDDEQSITLKRIRVFEERMSRGETIHKNLYDDFGAEIM